MKGGGGGGGVVTRRRQLERRHMKSCLSLLFLFYIVSATVYEKNASSESYTVTINHFSLIV